VRNTLDRALEKVREANVPKQPGERGRRPAVTLTWIEAGAPESPLTVASEKGENRKATRSGPW
jgi:hypothetical protein